MLPTESPNTIDLDLQKYWLILKRRWLPAVCVFSSILVLATGLAFFKPGYKARGKLLIKKMNQTSALTGLGQKIGELDTLTLQSNPLKTESEVISSTPLLQKTVDTLQLKNDDGSSIDIEKFAKKIKLKAIGATDVLEISYIASDAEKSAAVVNQLMRLYIENSIQTNRAEASGTIDFIAKQLPQTEARVRQADLALRRFKQQNQVVDLAKEAEAAVETISNLDKQIVETQAALKDVNARLDNLQNKVGVGVSSKQAIDLNSLNQSSGVQKALQEFQQVEAQLKVERTRLQDTNPTIVNLTEKRDALKTILQERVKEVYKSQQQVPSENLEIGESKQRLNDNFVKLEEERSGLASRLVLLSSARSNYQKRLSILPKLEEKQRQLERQLEAAQSTYQTLLKKLQEIRVAENFNTGNARIIQPALIPVRISLRKPAIIIGLGMVMGILLSGATIMLLEVRDTSVKTLQEIKDLFAYTLLGVIPSLKKQTVSRHKDTESTVPELPVRDTPRSPISDAYRQLQANLKFLNSDKALQVIVVTSSVPKEGKSTVSANLAAAIAQLGRRVLLVDSDLRHPVQHHIWGQTNVAGLSDVIIGQAEFRTVVNQVMDNLDVLTAGVIPPNPLALLDSNRMAALVESFCQTYDFVILDASPLLVGADALTLGKLTDGLLLVARPGVVNYTSAAASKELLEHSSQDVLGLVINGVILENESDSYFHYTKAYYREEDSTIRQKTPSQSRNFVS
ncbi:polysaccharide biosynthesis tyrosine autokinase [Chlorogloeopsis sp. ULAP01]|jgi:capsular exopolysaccharide synthesis family protein|uniref:GumC family protein n=1 Tax=Chlorogloeopsis sp. ULAP01 TaxID=3056483 RepID=UPI0025AB5861|nr:polysaccharide biosynthesis tyrosine autokinase [Chlorogloeopsis sp. ULAP01]MDM9383470.1 polysaccharide biosynthesis tyrosine autokinase [Chlorogloeopsis sp. ULAP01]